MVSFNTKMPEVSVRGSDSIKRLRQQIMVPFLWEDRPGLPKRDWKPAPIPSPTSALDPVPAPAPAPTFPAKLLVSVPFKWEEKPGTPLQCFSRKSSESNHHQQDEPRYLPPPPGYFQRYDRNDSFSYGSDDEYENWDSVSHSKFGAARVQTYLSFGSAQTLTANRLVPTAAISSAVPLADTCPMEQIDGKTGTAASSESNRCVSNYATVDASLQSTFLQHFFPLYRPKSSLLKKIKYPAQRTDEVFCTPERRYKSLDRERNQSLVIRMPPTLGDLIMLSRGSSRRKAMRENMLPVRELPQHCNMVRRPKQTFPANMELKNLTFPSTLSKHTRCSISFPCLGECVSG